MQRAPPAAAAAGKSARRPLVIVLLAITAFSVTVIVFSAGLLGSSAGRVARPGAVRHGKHAHTARHAKEPASVADVALPIAGHDDDDQPDPAQPDDATVKDTDGVPHPPQDDEAKADASESDEPASTTAASKQVPGSGGGKRRKSQAAAPSGGLDGYTILRVKKGRDIVDGSFYVLQDATTGEYLSRALDTNVAASYPKEKVFRFHYDRKYKAFALKGHTRMHLTNELSNKITVDRPWARGFEQFTFAEVKKRADGDDGPVFHMKSRRNSMLVSRSQRDAGGLVADESKSDTAVRWRISRVTSCDTEVACWGKETLFGESPVMRSGGSKTGTKITAGNDASDEAASGRDAGRKHRAEREQTLMQTLADFGPFPIVGSPKPLKSVNPLSPGDGYDPVTISRRTIKNWASIPGLASVQLTDDANTMEVISSLNSNVTARTKVDGLHVACATPLGKITADATFEMQPKFKQPTYRGLFQRGLDLYPDARGVMFSNGDILYTPSLTQTIARVLQFLDDKKAAFEEQGKPWHDRWMIVGQRINHDVPATWDLDDARKSSDAKASTCNGGFPQWVREIEGYAGQGAVFQSDAEDFFIVSRKMFDWNDIPDFVVGGVAFDNWITAKAARLALKGEAILVDGSKTITALHQNHGHDVKASHGHPKSVYNSHLAAQNGGIGHLGHTADAPVATERRADGSITVYDKHRLMFS